MDHITLTPEQQKARNRRNIMLALLIGAFVVLVYFVGIHQMQAHSPAQP